jgi:PBP1b-binding outer membrane lipoprotein LpoB
VIFARGSLEVAAALAAAAVFATGCSKQEAPKVDAATERQQAHDRAAKDVFGAQVQAIDKAKGMEADINKKAQENLDKADAMSK